jgi:hypothetical protein
MKHFVVTVLFCLVSNTVFAGSWETSSFRTASGQLVRIGMTKAEVRRDAGAPLDKDKATRVKHDGSAKRREKGEVWTYKGSDGIYSVRFNGDKVATIEVAPFRDR